MKRKIQSGNKKSSDAVERKLHYTWGIHCESPNYWNNENTNELNQALKCSYLVCVGANGLVRFKNPQEHSTLSKLLPAPTFRLTPLKLDSKEKWDEAVGRCKKDVSMSDNDFDALSSSEKHKIAEKRHPGVIWEFDERPWQYPVVDIDDDDVDDNIDQENVAYEIYKREGLSENLKRRYFKLMMSHLPKWEEMKQIEALSKTGPANPLKQTCLVWIHGSSHLRNREYARLYAKSYTCFIKTLENMDVGMWSNYMGEDVVIIDNVNKHNAELLKDKLAIWGDTLPFSIKIKGGGEFIIRPMLIIVTSLLSIEGLFANTQCKAIKSVCVKTIKVDSNVNEGRIIDLDDDIDQHESQ